MRIFKNRLGTRRFYFLFAIAFSLFVFPLPTPSANEKQDPTVTSKQIEALPRSTSSVQSSDDRVALYQALLDLQNPWTVMCIAAHPDDEDGTSLIVMRRKYGAHTVSLFSTFGEGGQNAIGPELYEELGAIRARETMAAAEIQGSEPHFLGLKDFGYSKTADEAFKFWGHEEALRRMVLEIRKLRPDVIITNHSVTTNDHGHHQATARLELEAFDAAADPKRFPEQLSNGVTVWQVQRLFVRARGNQTQNADAQIVTIDPNEKDPVRGVVYAEEALRALQKHATQGPWPKTFAEYATRFRAFSGQQSGTPGQLPMIRYALVREAKSAAPLSAKDSHNVLDGLALPADIARDLAPPNVNGSPIDFSHNREQAVDAYFKAYRAGRYDSTAGDSNVQRRERMHRNVELAVVLAAGLHFDTQVELVIPTSTVNAAIRVVNNSTAPLDVVDCSTGSITTQQQPASDIDKRVNHSTSTSRTRVAPGTTVTLSDKIQIPGNVKINVPLAEHLYEPSGMGLDLDIRCSYETAGNRLGIDLPLRVDVAPPVEIASIAPSPLALSPAKAKRGPATFTATMINHQNVPFDGRFMAAANTTDNWPNGTVIRLAAGEKKTITYTYAPPADANLADSNFLSFWVDGLKMRSPRETVLVFSTKAVTAPSLRVGYIRGFDFSLRNALNALGVESKELSVDDVRTADLSKYTSVIVDNRVYESQPELIATNQKLLDYANAGGNLIVFYHKSDEWNPDPRRNRPQLAPYKLVLGNERITDENAPITFIEPDHPLLNLPNKIGPDDFKDWIQERGLYYPREWDPQFHALPQSNDPGEGPLKGGLLVADYGRGHYIYSSMVWYRQLRAGVPGAYRMLANMISYGRK